MFNIPSCMAIFVEAEVDLETGNTKLVKVAGGTDIGQIIDSKAVEDAAARRNLVQPVLYSHI